MSTPQLERFLKDLRDSAVVPESELLQLLEQNKEPEPRGLAVALVQAGLLTDWQAKFILSGRNRLRVGNYLLQERQRRDELGDSFLAWHEPLHRQVRLQILPESVTRLSPMFQAVAALVGQLTALDHPRLEHLFDLGEEGGRLFVVYELVPGRQLDARSLATLTQGEAAGVLQGVSAALATLQSRNLAHGEIATAGLLLEPTGEGKLVGLCEANLRRALDPNSVHTEAEWLRLDRREWKELAERLMARQFRGPEFERWRSLLGRTIEEPEALAELAGEIETWRRELIVHAEASDLTLGQHEQPAMAREQDSPPPAVTQKEKSPPPSRTAPPRGRTPPALRGSAAARAESGNLGWRLYSLGVAVVAIVGLVGYLLWRFLPYEPSAQRSTAAVIDRDRERPIQPAGLNPAQRKSDQTANFPLPAGDEGRNDFSQPGEAPDAETPQLEQPEPGQLGREPGREVQQVDGMELKSSERIPGAGLVTDMDLSSATPNGAPPTGKQQQAPFQISAKESEQETRSEANPPNGAKEPAGEPSGSGLPESGQPAAGEPPAVAPVASWSGLPKVVNLGQPGEPARQLGAVPNLPPEQVALQLLFDSETVAKSRLVFELQPQPEKSSWAVISRRRAGDSETQAVGEFRWADGQLQFCWAEGLDSKSSALSLSNCLLKIEPPEGPAVVIALREPILVEGFQLEERTLKAEVKFDLPASPNPDSIAVVLGPFPKEGAWAEASVLNENFEERQPAVIVFRPVPNEQLFGLTIERRWRGQAELTAAWALQVAESPNKPGPSWVPARQAEFESLVESASQAYTQSVGISEAATRAAEDAPYGSKTKMRNLASEAKNNMLKLKAQRELLGVHQEKLAAIRGSDIPLRLVYRTAEHELVLAETSAARAAMQAAEAESEQPEKEKKNDAKGMK